MSGLFIPVIDRDLVREYSELSSLGAAIQQIRFRLDKTGAMLKSEALTVKAADQKLWFDRDCSKVTAVNGGNNRLHKELH